MFPKIPICIDCKHHELVGEAMHICQRKRYKIIDLVTGEKKVTGDMYCSWEREGLSKDKSRCGKIGQFFEQK